jgi:hypothetical protein
MWISLFSLNIQKSKRVPSVAAGVPSPTSGFDAPGADRGPLGPLGTGSLTSRHIATHHITLHIHMHIYFETTHKPDVTLKNLMVAFILLRAFLVTGSPAAPWHHAHLRSEAAGRSQVIDSWHSTSTFGRSNFGPPERNKTPYYQISRAPGILGFLGNIEYQGQDTIFWCSLRAQGSHEKTSASWFASVCTGSAFHKRNWSN